MTEALHMTTVPKLLRVADLEAQTGVAAWRWYQLFKVHSHVARHHPTPSHPVAPEQM
jgi:hypothetical protein